MRRRVLDGVVKNSDAEVQHSALNEMREKERKVALEECHL